MTTFTFTLLSKTNKIGEKTIAIVLVKDRKNTSVSIRQSCRKEDWSYDTMRVSKRARNARNINAFIDKYQNVVQEIIDQFEFGDTPYSLEEVVEAIKHHQDKSVKKKVSYTDYSTAYIKELKMRNKLSSLGMEVCVLVRLQDFFGRKRIEFRDLNYNTLNEFRKYLIARKNTTATIGIRLRCIRATFNRAIKEEIIPKDLYPFNRFQISRAEKDSDRRTKKQILMRDQIEQFQNYEPTCTAERWAKDIFLMSYYGRGINFLDLMVLKKSDRNGDHVNYIRRKTGSLVTFKITENLKRLFEKYAGPKEYKYLLSFVLEDNPTEQYLNNKKHKILAKVNKGLMMITKALNFEQHITYYCARHSFASILKFNNISIEIIREALGHRDIKSTMSYLAKLPDQRLDTVIEDVIS